jgi:hypothetical protein
MIETVDPSSGRIPEAVATHGDFPAGDVPDLVSGLDQVMIDLDDC